MLKIKTSSDVRSMSNCPKNDESNCGILYRMF